MATYTNLFKEAALWYFQWRNALASEICRNGLRFLGGKSGCKEGDKRMPYARISMMEFNSPGDMETAEEDYQRIREETFPGIQMTINVRTGPQSLLSLGVYPDQETAQANLEGRKKAVEDPEWVKDTFYYEGEVSFWKID